MSYLCLDCGSEFDEPASWQESRGEFWGMPCSETMYGCPFCHGDYVEVEYANIEEIEEEEGEEDECE